MSEAMTLAALLKSATEVTSLASSDRLLAFDSNGSLKKMSQSSCVDQGTRMSINLPAGKWSRIVTLRKSLASVGHVAISTSYPPMSILLGIGSQRTGILESGNLHVISCVGEGPNQLHITNVRISGKQSSDYEAVIDVYARTACTVEVYISGIGLSLANETDVAQYGSISFEYPLAYNMYWGGGKRLFINCLQFYTERRVAV